MAQANAPEGALQVIRVEPNSSSFLGSIVNYALSWWTPSRTKDTEEVQVLTPPTTPTRTGTKRSSDDEETYGSKRRKNVEQILPAPSVKPSANILAEPDALPYYPQKPKKQHRTAQQVLETTKRRRDEQQGYAYPHVSARAARRIRSSQNPNVYSSPAVLRKLKKEPSTPPMSHAQREKIEETKRRMERLKQQRGWDQRSKDLFGDPKKNGLLISHIFEAPEKPFQTLEEVRREKKQREIEISKLLLAKPDVQLDDPLPQLSSDQVQTVKMVLQRPNSVKVPALEFFGGFTLNARDISLLAPREWLNDNVMDFYLALVCHRANKNSSKHKKVHAFSTFFYKNLSSGGHNSVRRWAKKAGIEGAKLGKLDYLIVPINQNNSHWTLAVVNFKKKSFEYYDSLGGSMNEVFGHLRAYIATESQGTIDLSSWKDITMGKKGPQQANGFDCGVFVCKTAEVVARNRLPTFQGKDGVQLRYMMLLDILSGKLPDVSSDSS